MMRENNSSSWCCRPKTSVPVSERPDKCDLRLDQSPLLLGVEIALDPFLA
jgi:hypothetical protein